jgi:RNA polymerase sigma factor (TIGR02999 family)
MFDVTQLLNEIAHGDASAAERLLPLVYNELRSLAAFKMRQEKPGMTLQATALVHEAYLRLVGSNGSSQWANQAHFFAAAAESMRRILVEAARRKSRLKRGGDREREEVEEIPINSHVNADEILAVHEALDKLEGVQKEAAELVKLRFFAGFTIPESATMLGISPRKANQLWAYAKVWLLDEIGE